jgi:CDP-diacylglycerol pyrophosphatase
MPAICDDAGLKGSNGNDVRAKLRDFLLIGLAIAAAAACVSSAWAQQPHKGKSSTDSPIDPSKPSGRSSLRQTVQTLCVLNWQQNHNPAPCERVFLADIRNADSGYAVLADPGGGGHYLLVPTQTMAGLDSGELLDPDAPNYFALAWHARDLIAKYVGHDTARTAIGLAMGIAQSRTQDQFSIHIDCLQQETLKALRAASDSLGDGWSPITIAGSTYQATRIMGEGLDGANVFEVLAGLSSDARHHMGRYTLIVAGMQFKSGPGFAVLAGTGPSGEILLDSSCAVADAGG